MKTNRKAILAVIVVLAVTLSVVSLTAFALGAMTTAAASPTASGTNPYNWMSGDQWGNMMGNMMGGNYGSPSSTPTPVAAPAQNSILPVIGIVTLIGATLAGAIGAVYFFIGQPKIVLTQPQIAINPVSTVINTPSENMEAPIDTVSKTLTVDERKVVDVLTAHNGQYLQKYIRAETGLSRLKVHRIVTRLAERGIVTLEQSGNTNKVYLSSWLAKQPFTKIKSEQKSENQKEMVINA